MLNRSYWKRAGGRQRETAVGQRAKWWWPFYRNLGLLLLKQSQNMGNRCFLFLSVGLSCPQASSTVIWPRFSDSWTLKYNTVKLLIQKQTPLSKRRWLERHCSTGGKKAAGASPTHTPAIIFSAVSRRQRKYPRYPRRRQKQQAELRCKWTLFSPLCPLAVVFSLSQRSGRALQFCGCRPAGWYNQVVAI